MEQYTEKDIHSEDFALELKAGIEALKVTKRVEDKTMYNRQLAFLNYKFGEALKAIVDDGTMSDEVATLKGELQQHEDQWANVKVVPFPKNLK